MIDARTIFARTWGTPGEGCRITIASGAIASRFRAVSASVSPLVTDEAEAEMLTASAERRFAAISNDVRVLVEGSKKRLMTVLPRRVGTFLMSRVEISLNDSAVSRIPTISSTASSRIPKRSFLLRVTYLSAAGLILLDDHNLLLFIVVAQHDFDDFG